MAWLEHNTMHIIFEDSQARRVECIIGLPDSAGDWSAEEDALFDAIVALSGLKAVGAFLQRWHPRVNDGAGGAYATFSDGVLLVGRTVDGHVVKPTIPGPLESIFEADGVTLDLTNALVINAIDALTSFATSPSNGELIGEIRYGKRVKTARAQW